MHTSPRRDRREIPFVLPTEGGIVMIDAGDMSTPVTRGELRAELQQLEQKLAHLATKNELEIWGGGLLARIESTETRLIERIERLEERSILLEDRLLAELARHTKAICEEMSRRMSAIDEKYADLPSRVSSLETKAFTRGRRRNASR
jgi:hypothetical protein